MSPQLWKHMWKAVYNPFAKACDEKAPVFLHTDVAIAPHCVCFNVQWWYHAGSVNQNYNWSNTVSLSLGYHNLTIEYQQGTSGAALVVKAGVTSSPSSIQVLCPLLPTNISENNLHCLNTCMAWIAIHTRSSHSQSLDLWFQQLLQTTSDDLTHSLQSNTDD